MENQGESRDAPHIEATRSGAMRFAPMARALFIVTSALACAVSVARAQTPDLDAVQAETPSATPQLTEGFARETLAALDRLRAEGPADLALPSRIATSSPQPDPFTIAPSDNLADQALSALAEQQAADDERILQLQQEALARSNARIRAVQSAN